MRDIAVAQFTSKAAAADAVIQLGFVPDYVRVVIDIDGTPKVYEWFNDSKFSNWTAAAALFTRQIVDSGATGNSNLSKATSVIDSHAGGSTADGTTSYVNRSGAALASGKITGPGVLVKAAAQANSGKNLLLAYRNDI